MEKGNTATLGLRLFVRGKVVEITDGREKILLRWPSTTAPYRPPVETRSGFVGLAQSNRDLTLWGASEGKGLRRIAAGVTQGFAASEDGEFVAYGQSGTAANASTSLALLDRRRGVAAGESAFNGYAEPVGFAGSLVLLATGDGANSEAGLWNPGGGDVRTFPGYGSAVATDPSTGRFVLGVGDGRCWEVVSSPREISGIPRSQGNCDFRPQAFSPSGALLAGIAGEVDPGGTGGPKNGPDSIDEWVAPYRSGLAYHRTGVEIRAPGGRSDLAPNWVWVRLKLPLLPREQPSGLVRVCAAADFPNGISFVVDPRKITYVNPDITVYLDRLPVGDWVMVDARTWLQPRGTGWAEGALYDEKGRIGRSMQALLVEPRM